jgi:hypothetical protein
VNALIGMLYQPEEPRLTQAELNERVETTRFGDIINPINNVCSITHDVFEPDQQVARIRHCGHIFNSENLAHWLRINNTCPTCRYNLRSARTNVATTTTSATNVATTTTSAATNVATNVATTTTSSAPTSANMRRVLDIPLDSDIDINAVYNELLRNSANIPGFELNAVDDNSVVFSFDLMSDRRNGPGTGSGTGPVTGSGTGSGTGPRNIGDVD